MKAILMLEDGKSFSGEAIGSGEERIGEVIINTAVVGYQEMITDPANAGKILVLTYPLIGNYGIAPKFNESKKAWLSGLVIKEKTRIYSNFQAKTSFERFLIDAQLTTICGIDTRTLTVHLRQKGSAVGIISTETFEAKALLEKIASFRKKTNASLLPEISVRDSVEVGDKKAKLRVALLDIGVTNSVLKQLEALAVAVTVLPYNTSSAEILRLKPQGLIVSGGPEEDVGLEKVAANIKPLLGKMPILGIETGHQLLALALGAKLERLKFGHRGVNCPVTNPSSFKGTITAQNHGLAVEAESLSKIKDVKISAYNLNDRSVEEMESKKFKLIGVQYMPVSPGFNEVSPVFKRFIKLLKKYPR